VDRWKRALVATGVICREIDTFVDLVRQRADFSGVVSKWDVRRPRQIEPFINLLRALVLRGGVPVQAVGNRGWRDVRRSTPAIEKIYPRRALAALRRRGQEGPTT